MKPISIVIITYNEEENIRRCLESIKDIADEIVVLDSISTDKTKQICGEFNLRFIEQPFLGYVKQKNLGLQMATHEYVLSLDADEALDETLKKNILAEKENNFPFDTYQMNRLSSFCGQWMRHGSWYPDKKIRLFNKNKATWSGLDIHEKIVAETGSGKKHLQGDILHYTYETVEEIILKTNHFTNIQVKSMFNAGKRSNAFKLLVNPLIAFIWGYFIKLGFLDGYNGFIIARFASYSTLIKYAKLMHMQKKQTQGRPIPGKDFGDDV